jgi:hypothetical protein
MTEQPRFSLLDADRILKRASEFEGSEEASFLTLDELRAIAGEAGFGLHAVDRAIAEARGAVAPTVHPPPVRRWGWVVTRIATYRSLPVKTRSEDLMRAVRLFQPYRDGAARVRLEENEITWGDRKGLQFTVGSIGGTTEIRVYVSKLLLRRGRWVEWVKAAADRLETLVYLAAAEGVRGTRATPEARLPGSPGPMPKG